MELNIQNLTIQYEVIGKGEPLILLHGWRGSIDSLHELAMSLGKQFQVFNIELPGFGKSSEPPADWSIDEYVEFLNECINFLNIKDPMLVGHSFGGAIAFSYAAAYRVSQIVLIGAAIIREESLKTKIIKHVTQTIKKIFTKPPLHRFEHFARRSWYKVLREHDYERVSDSMKRVMKRVIAEDLRKQSSKVTSECLLVWGEKDRITPVLYAYEIQKLLPQSEVVIIPGYGHSLPLHAPKVVADLILKKVKK